MPIRETLRAFRAGKIDILVGTQMIAKGLHFPNVTLVGIINADLALHLPDFRAGERTFQLLTQVAGRAGRGETPGRSFRANVHAVQPVDSVRAASRLRRLLRAGAGVPGALRFPAVQACRPAHRPLGARSAGEVLRRDDRAPTARSVAGGIHHQRSRRRRRSRSCRGSFVFTS